MCFGRGWPHVLAFGWSCLGGCCVSVGRRLWWSFWAFCLDAATVRLVMWLCYQWLWEAECLTVSNLWIGCDRCVL